MANLTGCVCPACQEEVEFPSYPNKYIGMYYCPYCDHYWPIHECIPSFEEMDYNYREAEAVDNYYMNRR